MKLKHYTMSQVNHPGNSSVLFPVLKTISQLQKLEVIIRSIQSYKDRYEKVFVYTSSSLNGSFLILFPVRSKMALHNAGAKAGKAGSPTPPGGSLFSMMCTSI